MSPEGFEQTTEIIEDTSQAIVEATTAAQEFSSDYTWHMLKQFGVIFLVTALVICLICFIVGIIITIREGSYKHLLQTERRNYDQRALTAIAIWEENQDWLSAHARAAFLGYKMSYDPADPKTIPLVIVMPHFIAKIHIINSIGLLCRCKGADASAVNFRELTAEEKPISNKVSAKVEFDEWYLRINPKKGDEPGNIDINIGAVRYMYTSKEDEFEVPSEERSLSGFEQFNLIYATSKDFSAKNHYEGEEELVKRMDKYLDVKKKWLPGELCDISGDNSNMVVRNQRELFDKLLEIDDVLKARNCKEFTKDDIAYIAKYINRGSWAHFNASHRRFITDQPV